MCLICDRIKMIKEDRNPYFVKELKTGYVVIGDHQHFKGYTLFLCKKHKTELFQLEDKVKIQFLEEMSLVAEAVSSAFGAEKMNYELLGNGDTHLKKLCHQRNIRYYKNRAAKRIKHFFLLFWDLHSRHQPHRKKAELNKSKCFPGTFLTILVCNFK